MAMADMPRVTSQAPETIGFIDSSSFHLFCAKIAKQKPTLELEAERQKYAASAAL
jgi:hypothetical protein